MAEALSTEERALLKRALLNKGAEINEKLTRLMSGEQVSLGGILDGRQGELPIERLKRFMGVIEGCLRAIQAGSYGRCVGCGEGLSYLELAEVPWVDTCKKCGAPKT